MHHPSGIDGEGAGLLTGGVEEIGEQTPTGEETEKGKEGGRAGAQGKPVAQLSMDAAAAEPRPPGRGWAMLGLG